jgi:C-terminal processing protease CtpA/Prc
MARRIGWATLALCFSLGLHAVAGEKAHCTTPVAECTKAMYQKLAGSGWLGAEMAKGEQGDVTVKAVKPGSPAEAAGFQAGDVLVAINDVALKDANKEALLAAKKSLVAGSDGRYTVLRQGAKKTLTAHLVAPPREVLAQWLGEHVISEHVETRLASQ